MNYISNGKEEDLDNLRNNIRLEFFVTPKMFLVRDLKKCYSMKHFVHMFNRFPIEIII